MQHLRQLGERAEHAQHEPAAGAQAGSSGGAGTSSPQREPVACEVDLANQQGAAALSSSEQQQQQPQAVQAQEKDQQPLPKPLNVWQQRAARLQQQASQQQQVSQQQRQQQPTHSQSQQQPGCAKAAPPVAVAPVHTAPAAQLEPAALLNPTSSSPSIPTDADAAAAVAAAAAAVQGLCRSIRSAAGNQVQKQQACNGKHARNGSSGGGSSSSKSSNDNSINNKAAAEPTPSEPAAPAASSEVQPAADVSTNGRAAGDGSSSSGPCSQAGWEGMSEGECWLGSDEPIVFGSLTGLEDEEEEAAAAAGSSSGGQEMGLAQQGPTSLASPPPPAPPAAAPRSAAPAAAPAAAAAAPPAAGASPSAVAWQQRRNWGAVFDPAAAPFPDPRRAHATAGLHHKLLSPDRLRKKTPLETRLAAEERQARAERLRSAQIEDKVARLASRAREKAARSKVRRRPVFLGGVLGLRSGACGSTLRPPNA